jgi:DNA-binding MarR family transcriptional regulator
MKTMNSNHNAALKHYYQLRRDSWNTWAPHSLHDRTYRYLTASQHREIIRLVQECGETMAAVARKLGLNYSTVTKITYGMHKPKSKEAIV